VVLFTVFPFFCHIKMACHLQIFGLIYQWHLMKGLWQSKYIAVWEGIHKQS
jgi:hypothetical protein